jgi:hypothetical protein
MLKHSSLFQLVAYGLIKFLDIKKHVLLTYDFYFLRETVAHDRSSNTSTVFGQLNIRLGC